MQESAGKLKETVYRKYIEEVMELRTTSDYSNKTYLLRPHTVSCSLCVFHPNPSHTLHETCADSSTC